MWKHAIEKAKSTDTDKVINAMAAQMVKAQGGVTWTMDMKKQPFYDFAEELADRHIMMERGEVIKPGRGANMEADGVRGVMSI